MTRCRRHALTSCEECHAPSELRQRLAAAEAALAEEGEATERLAKAARECADDLEAELRHRYGYPDIHPAMQYKYDRDMEPVLAVRAARAPRP